MGKYAWSLEWQKAKEPTWFWKMVLKKKRGGKVDGDYLRRLQNWCDNKDWWQLTETEILS